ncbi:MAG: cobalamin biosynthesis protein, partial [Psychromonas sp.]|nr:cobalamin biosynthesis protein [Psychromonas sp.]
GMPFRVALNNVIKKHNPQRLFIEPAGAGHLANIKSLLQGEFYHPVLTLENTLCLLANWQLNEAKYANNENFLALIEEADKLCFYEQSAEKKTKKMAFEYSKPFSRLHYTVEDLS